MKRGRWSRQVDPDDLVPWDRDRASEVAYLQPLVGDVEGHTQAPNESNNCQGGGRDDPDGANSARQGGGPGE